MALISRFPNMVVIPPDRPFKTMAELIAHAKANPGKLNYGSFGNGTSPHLFAELLKSMAKLDITHIPYKGAAPAIIDLLGGRLDMFFSTAAGAAGHVRSGKLRPDRGHVGQALVGLSRCADRGGVRRARLRRAGLVWRAGAGRHAARIVARLQVGAGFRPDEFFRKRAQEDGIELDIGGPEALAKFMQTEEARWRKVVKEAGIKPE